MTIAEDCLHLIAAEGRWPKQLADLTDLVSDCLPGPESADRRVLACRIVTRIASEYGGSNLYIPKTDAIARALRDLTIWSAHDGTVNGASGIRALARQHKMTENAIWDILRAQRSLHRGTKRN